MAEITLEGLLGTPGVLRTGAVGAEARQAGVKQSVLRDVWFGASGGEAVGSLGEGAGGVAGSGVKEVSILVSHSRRASGSLMLPRPAKPPVSGLPGSSAPSFTSRRGGAAEGVVAARGLLGELGVAGEAWAERRSSARISEALRAASPPPWPPPFLSGEAAGRRRRVVGEVEERSRLRKESRASPLGEDCRLLSVSTPWGGSVRRFTPVVR